MSPTVSAVLPSYMHEAYVGAAVRSVLDQTYADLELVVVEDGSTDRSLDRIREAAAGDPRVRVLRHPDGDNHGLNASLRLATGAATGRVLAVIASDDHWLPHRLAAQVGAVLRHGAGYARVALVDEDERYLVDVPKYGVGGPRLFRQLLWKNVVPATTIMVRRDVFDRVGGFYGEPRYEDLDLMLRVSATCAVSYVPDVVAHHRTLSTGLERTVAADGRGVASVVEVLDRLVAWPGLPRRLHAVTARWHDTWHLLADIAAGTPPATRVTTAALVRLARLRQIHDEVLSPEQRQRVDTFLAGRPALAARTRALTRRTERVREVRERDGLRGVARLLR